MTLKRHCWCSGQASNTFTSDYNCCENCGTLVSNFSLPDEAYQVSNDETDFYGKQYWLNHQSGDLGYPNIFARSRTDLLDRNIHWLKTLLRYKAPPAKVLELGCSHGSFVALLRQAGYDAIGMEMSPWVVEYAKSTFDIPAILGPIESANVEEASLDVVVLMDVLEHLPLPNETMGQALSLLKPDGILLVQMPQFPGALTFEQLSSEHPEFLKMLLPDEHIYLYTQNSARRLFHKLGAEHLAFEKPVFSEHDMFFVVSRQPLVQVSDVEGDKSLDTPRGRFVQALLDQDSQIKKLAEHIEIIDADRAARLEQIHTLTKMVHDLQNPAKR